MEKVPVLKPSRLGYGEYEPADAVASTAVARRLFLEAARRMVPQGALSTHRAMASLATLDTLAHIAKTGKAPYPMR